MTKRLKFVLASILLAGLLWGTQFVVVDHRLQAILILVVMAYVMTAWALFDDLKGIEWLTIMILPVTYTLGAGLFSLFLPDIVPRLLGVRMSLEVGRLIAGWVRLLFWVGFGVGFYAIFLTENIYSVAAIRTIQLVRAAHTVGFLLTLLVGLFLFQAIFSFKLAFYWTGLLVMLISVFLFLQGTWSVQLKDGMSRKVMLYSFFPAVILAEVALGLSFWPADPLAAALILVTGLYVMLGLIQQYLRGRLFRNQINEHVAVAVVVLLASFYITSWR